MRKVHEFTSCEIFMNKVLVLLSSYNGEKYIKEQINSILNQKNVDINILIRDDGSSDNTQNILKEIEAKCSRIHCIFENNIGYKHSFMKLVYQAGSEYDYYAFADQDDVWLEDKMSAAISMIDITSPCLYYSMMSQVDVNLNMLEEQQEYKYPLNKKMILFQNFVQGSTIVFNKKLYSLLHKYKMSKEVAHDIWIPIVASYFGKIVEKPYIGDATRAVETEDIRRANRLLYATAFLCEIGCLLVLILV